LNDFGREWGGYKVLVKRADMVAIGKQGTQFALSLSKFDFWEGSWLMKQTRVLWKTTSKIWERNAW
jgi:hypothetical protein